MKKYTAILICGFVSGFTLLLSGNTLNFWLASNHVDKSAIGLFSLATLPYAINAVWSPCLDIFKVPILSRFLDQRMSWIWILQILLIISVLCMSFVDPKNNLETIAVLAFGIAFFGSTQDVAIGALRAEIISKSSQGKMAGVYIFGYRLGTLASSSGAVLLSVYYSWSVIYKIFACVILLFPILIYITTHSFSESKIKSDSALFLNKEFFINALRAIGSVKYLALVMAFLVLYRLPDNFINAMINPFLLEKGFTAIEIASVGKFLGITAAILGGFLGSYIMSKISITKALLSFGIVHAIAHLMFIVQNNMGHNVIMLFLTMGFESVTGGI